MTDRLFAGIELGGTKCIALIARGRDVLALERLATGEPEATLAALGDALDRLMAAHGPAAAIGIGSFGPLGLDPARADYGRITTTPKPGWPGTDVLGFFERRFGLPTAIDTDVAGAALAEHRWGAAQGCDVAAYLTVGTGVGAGIVVDGRPVRGLVHPELGHVRVRRRAGDAFRGVCPFHGDCLEGLVSGPAIAARTGLAGEAIAEDHPVWDAVIAEFAEAMAILILTLSPRRILLGGGVFQLRPALLPALRARTAALLGGYVTGIDADALAEVIIPPGLGALAGPLGTIALADRAR